LSAGRDDAEYAFAENLLRVTSRFSVTPGIRYEIIESSLKGVINNASFPVAYTGKRNFPLLGTGLQYQVSSGTQLYGNVSQAYRPYIYASITPADQVGVIDPNLKDGKGYDGDLGYRGRLGDWLHFGLHAVTNPVFWIMALGVFTSWALYIWKPHLPGVIDSKLKPLRVILENKYYFDWFNENVLAKGSRLLGKIFWRVGDQIIIDKIAVDGSANTVGFIASIVRRVQSGFLYSYAFWMVIGLAVMLGWFVTRA